ncbi:mitogen-activated protein kinase kinase kinase 1 [Vigna unguiculata]|uniref:Mitogen-activated protein kinase kinase kinase 1 n=1 Tax=Vigna unguiculata TaxID=3917 RepID=A0A4D6KPH5_VIGUN|nr:mitogen-activated protein kinase kinase kinase 1 [Vigna unguiculata]
MDSATGRIDAAIKSSSDSISGNGEGRVHGFGWAVDSAVRSTIASNSEISSVHGFGWAVENGIKSSTAPNFETQDTVHSIRWAVDDAIRSRVAPNPAPLHGFSSAVDNAISSKVGAETAAEAETDSEAELKEAWYVEGSWQKDDLVSHPFPSGFVFRDGFFFAAKEVSLLDDRRHGKQCIFQLQQEISLLSQLRHDNIVRYLGTDKDNDKLYIFLEIVTKGSLAVFYKKYHLMDSQVSAYTRQILSGLKYLHDLNVVHRDIKCANILVDATGSVKLADFGLAKVTKLNDVKSIGGSLYWMAPEVVNLRSGGYGLAADIWSLGCTVLEMLTRQPPYSHLEPKQAVVRIGRGELPLVPESLSINARDFILKCLQLNPNKRPTAAHLLDHPFVIAQQPDHPFTKTSSAAHLLDHPFVTAQQPDHPFTEKTSSELRSKLGFKLTTAQIRYLNGDQIPDELQTNKV